MQLSHLLERWFPHPFVFSSYCFVLAHAGT